MLSNLLNERQVTFINASNKAAVLKQLVSYSCHTIPYMKNFEDEFTAAIFKREEVVSTALGLGVAIPHAKLNFMTQPFITIGHLRPAVDWDSLDEIAVFLVFMIGCHPDKQSEYLYIIRDLVKIIRQRATLKELERAKDEAEIITILRKKL
ncbi:MAG: PTS sugar transporter subunit IIA [Spirochaetaceae bacterium]|nr:PTS sugar transporter subunit IIA [Spirochaetaceae bacterium]